MNDYLKEHMNSIILSNAYEEVSKIQDNCIDLVIIDPPYEYQTGGTNNWVSDRPYHKQYNEVAKKTYRQNDDKIKQRKSIRHLSTGIDYKLLDDLDRVMKKINIYIWCSKAMISTLLKHYEDKNCNIDIITWHKTNPIPVANNSYMNDTEYCVFARDKGVKLFGDLQTKKKFYVTGVNTADKVLYKHPTIKPLNIIKNFIINSSNQGDVILDCFSGSGTTCVAAKELNRNFIGIELDKDYHKISIDRVNGITADGQTSIFTDFDKVQL